MKHKVFQITFLIFIAAILWVTIFLLGTFLQSSSYFKDFRQRVQQKEFPQMRTKAIREPLTPTVLPFKTPSYFSDVKIRNNNVVNLRDYISSLVVEKPDVLIDSSLQIQISEKPGVYRLEINSELDSDSADLRLILFDAYLRPVKALISQQGKIKEEIEVGGEIYKISLTCKGILGKNYYLNLGIVAIKEENKEFSKEEDIPVLNLHLPPSSEIGWKWLLTLARRYLQAAGGQGQPVNFLPNKSVKGSLVQKENIKSTVDVSLCGLGLLGHFDEKNPSFTINTLSGHLFFGMRNFKLYSIKNKEGFLDYVAGSIMRDEGLFVPRWLLVRMYLNKRYLGLYVLEEIYSPEFFEGMRKYEGEVHGLDFQYVPRQYYRPKVEKDEPSELPPLFTEAAVSISDKIKFAKGLAFITRYHATHGTQVSDFRLYRDPLLGSLEPILRDLDVGMWGVQNVGEERSFLVHASWWYGKRFFGSGPHFNSKVYPAKEILTGYTQTPFSLGLASVSPAISLFLQNSKNREIFEKFLFYVSDSVFLNRFLNRFFSLFKAAKPFLGEDEELIRGQIQRRQFKKFNVVQHFYTFLDRVYLLVIEEQLSEKPSEPSAFFLYNFSCFSLTVGLPKYVSIDDSLVKIPGNKISDNSDLINLYLAPSVFYPLLNFESLNKTNLSRIIYIEKLRYLTLPSLISTEGAPLIKVLVPQDKKEDFRKFLKENSNFMLAGVTALAKDKIVFDSELPDASSQNQTIKPDAMSTPQLNILPIDLIPTPEGYILRYLLINYSLREVEIDLSKLYISRGLSRRNFICEIECDPKIANILNTLKVNSWRIFDSSVEPISQKLILGPAAKLDKTTLLWTDAFLGGVYGPLDPQKPNVALLQIEIPIDNQKAIHYITDPKVFADAITNYKDLQIVVHENCVNFLFPHSLHKNWQVEKDFNKNIIDQSIFDIIKEENAQIPKIKFKNKENVISTLLVIPEGYMLEIEPGTKLFFGENGGILSFSSIKAVGSKDEPIIFIPQESVQDWLGIAIVNASELNRLEYVKISHARGGRMGPYFLSGGLSVLHSSIDLSYSEITDSPAIDGIHFFKSWFKVSHLKLSRTQDDGFDCDWGFGSVSDSEFSSTGGDCLDFSGSYATVNNSSFSNSEDKGVSVGEASIVDILSSNFSKNKIGVAVKDGSKSSIKTCNFSDNKVGIALYIKKPGYAYPSVDIKEAQYQNNVDNIIYEPSAHCTERFN